VTCTSPPFTMKSQRREATGHLPRARGLDR
jgi:hypothetical protein